MAAFTISASKAQPSNFAEWTVIPGDGNRAVLKITIKLEADIVLVIDTNKSMEEFWSDMAADCAQLSYPCMDKDGNGMDLYLAGVDSDEPEDEDSPAGGFLNVANPLYLPELLQKVKETGFSNEEAVPTVVANIFKKYLDNYTAASPEARAQIKKLIVIVWTDGTFPQAPFEETLVSNARALDTIGAPEDQVGIQLYQVGNADGVKEAFTRYDDNLQELYKLGRDYVDYTRYVPNSFTVESITKVVAGSVVKSLD